MANNGSFSSLFNLQSNSINFKFGHVWAQYQGYSLTFWPETGSFSSLFNLQSNSINFKFGHFWAQYQGYSLPFWPNVAHVHHFSICNQNQSISNLVIFGQTTKAIALLFGQIWLIFITFQSAIKFNQFQISSFLGKIPRLWPYFFATYRSFSSLVNLESKSINFKFGHFGGKYQGYSLTFWPKWLIFITFQSVIKINQFQIWSFLGKVPRL